MPGQGQSEEHIRHVVVGYHEIRMTLEQTLVAVDEQTLHSQVCIFSVLVFGDDDLDYMAFNFVFQAFDFLRS